MIGTVNEIIDNKLIINTNSTKGVINSYVKIISNNDIFIGELVRINNDRIEVILKGELINNEFKYGCGQKPILGSNVEELSNKELNLLFGASNYSATKSLYIGKSVQHKDYSIYANINNLFSNHLVFLGTTGSGKSCGIARLYQNLFYKNDSVAKNATIFIIDAYGEYQNAFSQINAVNKELCFKSYTSDSFYNDQILNIPPWLLSLDDYCLLLGVKNKNQIPLVEKALKIVNIFNGNSENVTKYKNSIIAKAILDIFVNGNTPAQIRDQIFSVLSRYNTEELNLETPIVLPGYTRPLKQCLRIDETGKISEMELLNKFLQQYIVEEMNLELPDGSYTYSLKDVLYAMDFALIDEGILNNNAIYDLAHELRVNLAGIIDSDKYKMFDIREYCNKDEFFKELTHTVTEKAQVINISLNNLDDRFAKVVAKIYSKFLFDYAKNNKTRAENPIHIVLEEAHRYVQNDEDNMILGYNIFERIAREGRKYAILLNLICQRPSELSSTVLSQCENCFIYKITNAVDLEFVRSIVPYVDDNTIEQIKNLQIGNALVFGRALLMPTLVKIDMATPAPTSTSCDISTKWF